MNADRFEVSVPADSVAAAVILHPHPDYGGNRHNNVVHALFEGLPAAGIAALRFDFRSSDMADAEGDAQSAIEAMAAEAPGIPLVLAGYSFGGDVAAGVSDSRLAGWFLVAPPLRYAQPPVASDARPKAIAVPEHDQFSPPAATERATASWANTAVRTVAGADHFLVGRTDAVTAQAVAFVRELVGR